MDVRGAILVVLLAAVLLPMGSASAVRTTTYADWGAFSGTANDYTTSVQLPVTGFPAAEVTSDSRAGSVGIQTGASSWFGDNTPIGVKYGSSRNQPYLNLRPKVDNASGGSSTTYVFDEPTPPTGWMFALSDIDADQAQVSATLADGTAVSAAGLGFVAGFNFCDTTPRPGSCSTSIGDAPTWDPATQVLLGNPGASDTVGATGYFEPSVAIKTLTIVFTRRAGFPIYSTTFAAVARTLSGQVDDVSTGAGDCPPDSVTVRLVGPHGEDLGSTTPDAGGAYSFGQVATQPGYTVELDVPAGCAPVGPRSRTVSTAGADAIADFSIRAIIPQPVSGTVTADGVPLAGVEVTLHVPGGTTKTTTTGDDGTYLIDDNAVDTGYFVSIDVPDGYTGSDQRAPFDVDTTPITGQDFALNANPDVSGTVTGGGTGVGGVPVTLTPASGPPLQTQTEADGTYRFDRVPTGTYEIAIEAPDGYNAATPLTGVVVGSTDVTGQDFELTRPGAVSGEVVDDAGAPVPDSGIVVDGPGGERDVTTDDAGQYFVDGLTAGTYTIEVDPPDGFQPVGPDSQSTTITTAGEIRGGIDFALEAVPVATPTPTPTSSPTPSTGASGPSEPTASPSTGPTSSGGGDLPNAGGPGLPTAMTGLLLTLGGAGVLLVARRQALRSSGTARRGTPPRPGR